MRRFSPGSYVGAVLFLLVLSAPASGYEFRCRWVERIGTVDLIIGGDGAVATFLDFAPHRIRLQFGVFDDAAGPAPAGGFVGWNVGTLDLSAGSPPDARRTPGRITPFTFATQAGANGNPPLPGGDPFMHLSEIDATLGTQSPTFDCRESPLPIPLPPPQIRGLNEYISVYEITVQNPATTSPSYDLVAGGHLVAATEWRIVGTPVPPDCGDPSDPNDDIPGSVTYAPFPTPPRDFQCTLHVIPAPMPGVIAVFFLSFHPRRRSLQ